LVERDESEDEISKLLEKIEDLKKEINKLQLSSKKMHNSWRYKIGLKIVMLIKRPSLIFVYPYWLARFLLKQYKKYRRGNIFLDKSRRL